MLISDGRKLALRIPSGPAPVFADTLSFRHGSFDNGDTVLSDDQPYEAGTAARFRSRRPEVRGYSELISLSERSVLIINDYQSTQERWVKSTMKDCVSFVFRLIGDSVEFFDTRTQVDRSRLECSIVRYPDGMERSTWVPADNHIRSVGMYYDPGEIRQTLGYGPDNTSERMHALLASSANVFSMIHLPCTSEMQRAALSLFNTPFRGRVRTAFARATATELACWSLKAFVDQEAAAPPPVHLSEHDTECLYQARNLLLADLKNPLTIGDLSRRVGINRNKLSYGFKHLFGECVSEFCQKMRMECAWELLNDNKLTISQIAEAVGYTHPQNFSTAFRQHYGVMPKDIRRA